MPGFFFAGTAIEVTVLERDAEALPSWGSSPGLPAHDGVPHVAGVRLGTGEEVTAWSWT